jgi:hypothetical protein
MSVDTKLYQVTQEELELFSKDKSAFLAFQEEVADSYFFPTTPPSADQRMMKIDEFSKSLLADSRDDIYCVSIATTYGGNNPIKWGESMGTWMPYLSVDEVKKLAEELEAYPLEELFARLDGIIEDTRINAAGFLDGDEAIRNYQIEQWNKVVEFYRRAADANRAVLVDVG